jgi:hypothetical protein
MINRGREELALKLLKIDEKQLIFDCIGMGYKKCSKCGKTKKISEYYQKKNLKCVYPNQCKQCMKKEFRKYRVKNAEKIHELSKGVHLKHKYNMSLLDLEKIKESQSSKCPTCHEIKKLEVDHDHYTNKVRGLLCHQCNVAVGCIRDSPLIAKEIMNYLIASEARGINYKHFMWGNIFDD